jgi:hypothetical protein
MDVGWVPDNTQGGLRLQNWSPGDPQPSWPGLKPEKEQAIPVTTFRCSKCGYLESFALPESQSSAVVSGSSRRWQAAVALGLGILLLGIAGIIFLIHPVK